MTILNETSLPEQFQAILKGGHCSIDGHTFLVVCFLRPLKQKKRQGCHNPRRLPFVCWAQLRIPGRTLIGDKSFRAEITEHFYRLEARLGITNFPHLLSKFNHSH